MEEISFIPLSEGLGFYEKSQIFNSADEKSVDLQKKTLLSIPELPHLNLPETLDLDDSKNYEHLIALLEKPWLGKNVSGSFSENIPVSPENKEGEKVVQPSSTNIFSPSEPLGKEKVTAQIAPVNPTSSSESALGENTISRNTLDKSISIKNENNLVHEKTFYFSLKAYFVDACVISLLFFPPFVLFVFLTQSTPIVVLKSVWPHILLAFLFFSQIYCLLCRLFCFETYGEAFAKIRLFTLNSSKETHPYMLFWRFFISCVTGFIFLPLLSLIFRKDFMARLTGLYFRKI